MQVKNGIKRKHIHTFQRLKRGVLKHRRRNGTVRNPERFDNSDERSEVAVWLVQ